MQRFWDKVKVGEPDECWLWLAATHENGYGAFQFRKRKTVKAHRMAYWLVNDEWPRLLRHLCHNKRCVNPAHLTPGDARDNWVDSFGVPAHVSQVRLLAGTMPQREIAARLGIGQGTVSRILTGKRWNNASD